LRFVGQLKPARCGTEPRSDAGSFGLARFAPPILFVACLVLGLQACGPGGGDNGEKLGERVIPLGQPVPKGGGVYMVGQPYQIAGILYTPREEPNYDRVGNASWYGELFHGRRTANGEIYDMDRLSAAHPTLPLPIYARVTNLNNGRSIVVRVNDRGPYAGDRIIDLSRRSAELLGFRNQGTATVRVRYLRRAPLDGDDGYERKYLASQSWVQLAAKASKGGADENLALPWKTAAPRQEAAPPDAASLGKQATAHASETSLPQTTGSLPPSPKMSGPEDGPVIQAGSFKSKENAERARDVLSPIAPVDVTPIAVGEEVFFRVRVGPFATASEAQAALAKVAGAGYRGAKLVGN
jgi:rare lipoprotein A